MHNYASKIKIFIHTVGTVVLHLKRNCEQIYPSSTIDKGLVDNGNGVFFKFNDWYAKDFRFGRSLVCLQTVRGIFL